MADVICKFPINKYKEIVINNRTVHSVYNDLINFISTKLITDEQDKDKVRSIFAHPVKDEEFISWVVPAPFGEHHIIKPISKLDEYEQTLHMLEMCRIIKKIREQAYCFLNNSEKSEDESFLAKLLYSSDTDKRIGSALYIPDFNLVYSVNNHPVFVCWGSEYQDKPWMENIPPFYNSIDSIKADDFAKVEEVFKLKKRPLVIDKIEGVTTRGKDDINNDVKIENENIQQSNEITQEQQEESNPKDNFTQQSSEDQGSNIVDLFPNAKKQKNINQVKDDIFPKSESNASISEPRTAEQKQKFENNEIQNDKGNLDQTNEKILEKDHGNNKLTFYKKIINHYLSIPSIRITLTVISALLIAVICYSAFFSNEDEVQFKSSDVLSTTPRHDVIPTGEADPGKIVKYADIPIMGMDRGSNMFILFRDQLKSNLSRNDKTYKK